ncbi:hypothetical protein D3C86_1400400 [compost metagenome]
MITDGFGSLKGNVKPAQIAHDRVTGINQRRVLFLQIADQPCDGAHLRRAAEITGQDSLDLADPFGVFEVGHCLVEIVVLKAHAGGRAVAGMPGHDDGWHRPDRITQRLKRKDRRAVADGATHDMAGNDDDSALCIFLHHGLLAFKRGRKPASAPRPATAKDQDALS